MDMVITTRDRAKYSGVARFINTKNMDDAALVAAFFRLHCHPRFYKKLQQEFMRRGI